MACKATTKISSILDESRETVDAIHDTLERVEAGEDIDYSVEDSKKDLVITYAQTGLKITKLYAPAAILATVSISSIVASHHILRKRNVALAAAYATVDKSFKEYRNRVTERFGNEVEREIRYGIKAKEFTETKVDENGKEKSTEITTNVVDTTPSSPYAKFFDASSKAWEKDPEYNLMFLRGQQAYANDLLRARGHLYLNEVYDMLDIPRTKAGQVVGWIYDEKNPIGDNYVDFGIYETHRMANRDFVNGYEPVIILDFNVDGNIFDKM
jgi:hypothetical protein